MTTENKRKFIRRESKSMCEVRLDSEISKGIVIDYAEGLCVIMKNSPAVVKGAKAGLKILDCGTEINAEIVWTAEDDFGYVRIGFMNTGNFKGSIKYYSLNDILAGIKRNRITGVLKISTNSILKKFHFDNGDLIPADPEGLVPMPGEITEGTFELIEKKLPADETVMNGAVSIDGRSFVSEDAIVDSETENLPDQEASGVEEVPQETGIDQEPDISEEPGSSRRSRSFYVMLLILVIAVSAFTINYCIGRFLSPLPAPEALAPESAVRQITSFPTHYEMAIEKFEQESSQRAILLPYFREEALKKLEMD